MKASAWRAISAFLWCMSATAINSPTVLPVSCNQKYKLQFFITQLHTMMILAAYKHVEARYIHKTSIRQVYHHIERHTKMHIHRRNQPTLVMSVSLYLLADQCLWDDTANIHHPTHPHIDQSQISFGEVIKSDTSRQIIRPKTITVMLSKLNPAAQILELQEWTFSFLMNWWLQGRQHGWLPYDMTTSWLHSLRHLTHEADASPTIHQINFPAHLLKYKIKTTKRYIISTMISPALPN